jgi:hypothetical protein
MAAPAPVLLDQLFLELRCRCLDLGAALDRIERAAESDSAVNDPRWEGITEALRILLRPGRDRAEQIQLLFSDEYDAQWRSKKTAAPTRPG